MNSLITLLMVMTSVVNIINIYSLWREKRTDKSDARFKSIDTSLAEHQERLVKLEESTRRAPTHSDLERVYESINALAKTVHQLVGQNENQTRLLNQLVNKAIDGGHHDKCGR